MRIRTFFDGRGGDEQGEKDDDERRTSRVALCRVPHCCGDCGIQKFTVLQPAAKTKSQVIAAPTGLSGVGGGSSPAHEPKFTPPTGVQSRVAIGSRAGGHRFTTVSVSLTVSVTGGAAGSKHNTRAPRNRWLSTEPLSPPPQSMEQPLPLVLAAPTTPVRSAAPSPPLHATPVCRCRCTRKVTSARMRGFGAHSNFNWKIFSSCGASSFY